MIKTCPQCGGLFCTRHDEAFAGRACNCGYAEVVTLSLADAVQRIKELQSQLSQAKEENMRLQKAIAPMLKEIIDFRNGLLAKSQHVIAPTSDTLHWDGYTPSDTDEDTKLAEAWTKLITPVEKALKREQPGQSPA